MTLFNRFKEICLDGVPADYLFEKFNSAAGNEIQGGKIFSPRSSSALCMNAFGWFIERPEEFPAVKGLENLDWPALSVDIECQLRFPWRGGRSPWLDAVIETEHYLIGVESKRFEPFRKSTPSSMSKTYWEDYWGGNMSGYQSERDKFRDKPKHYKHLSSRQLVAHSLGLKTQANKKNKKPVLLYIHCDKVVENPVLVSAKAVEKHHAEIAEFATSVSGDEVSFESLTYRELLSAFTGGGLVTHSENLDKVYDLI